ncbi:MAG: hypothetical protein IT537_01130 [Hyphomicrobiales bacterium]|nr:hypothetical protein [Hyphomicrobiales bacterium]
MIRADRLLRRLCVAALGASLGAPHAYAQFFDGLPTLRPPSDVPSVPTIPLPSNNPPSSAPAAPKGPLQPSPAVPNPTNQAAPAVPAGQGALSVSARFGRDLAVINGGLSWRVYRTDQNGVPRLVKEDKGPTPTFVLPPGAYVVHAGFGLAGVTKVVQLRAEQTREVFEIPAGGLRIEGRVGDARIPAGQISFDLYKGSQFEPGDKRPIATGIATGDLVLIPEGTYHVVSNYGDANATVRSDIRVQTGKLTDATVSHRAAIVTLKLVNERGGEARANTQWSVLTPGGDVIKESIGAFPRVILAEGEYRAIARNDNRTYEREFRVVNGVDGEIEVIAR